LIAIIVIKAIKVRGVSEVVVKVVPSFKMQSILAAKIIILTATDLRQV
jgi:hypothetical protein